MVQTQSTTTMSSPSTTADGKNNIPMTGYHHQGLNSFSSPSSPYPQGQTTPERVSRPNGAAGGGSYSATPPPRTPTMATSAAATGAAANSGNSYSTPSPSSGTYQSPTSPSPSPSPSSFSSPQEGLRRRHYQQQYGDNGGAGPYHTSPSQQQQQHYSFDDDNKHLKKALALHKLKKLDMFPKVERDLTQPTTHGRFMTILGYVLIVLLMGGEIYSWTFENRETVEHVVVDTSLGKRMRVNINITFPALACEDLHVDAMDVAGDSQIDIEDTLVKRRLNLDGTPMLNTKEIRVEANINQIKDKEAEEAKKKKEKEGNATAKEEEKDYCGPCYGAEQRDGQCCNTCTEVMEAYRKKRWNTAPLSTAAEQCIRENAAKDGKDPASLLSSSSPEPKRMTKGEGCNLSGYMTVNRVGGNFHVAMGEGVERNGRHIHQFLPEDAVNFNASHTIHELSFGPKYSVMESGGLEGVQKVTTDATGTTGLFQYFIKVVPTTYRGKELLEMLLVNSDDASEASDGKGPSSSTKIDLMSSKKKKQQQQQQTAKDTNLENELEPFVETNRYFFTERFRPLMTELIDDEHKELGEGKDKLAGAYLGGSGSGGSQNHHDQHRVQNSVLPGVFFVYEIYPFAVEVTKKRVPLTHLLIRLMATIGGVIIVVGWLDAMLCTRDKKRRRKNF